MKYTEKEREAKRSIKADKRQWMENIARKAEDEGPRQSKAILDKNGNLVSGKDEVWSRWTEQFKDVLNREEPENVTTDDEECKFNDMIEEIAVNEPTLAETKAVIKIETTGRGRSKTTWRCTVEREREEAGWKS